LWWGNLLENVQLGDLEGDGKITLKCIERKYVVRIGRGVEAGSGSCPMADFGIYYETLFQDPVLSGTIPAPTS
jgi:hypothetical protein